MAQPLESLTLATLRRMLRATIDAVGPNAPSVQILRRAVAAKRRPRSQLAHDGQDEGGKEGRNHG